MNVFKFNILVIASKLTHKNAVFSFRGCILLLFIHSILETLMKIACITVCRTREIFILITVLMVSFECLKYINVNEKIKNNGIPATRQTHQMKSDEMEMMRRQVIIITPSEALAYCVLALFSL